MHRWGEGCVVHRRRGRHWDGGRRSTTLTPKANATGPLRWLDKEALAQSQLSTLIKSSLTLSDFLMLNHQIRMAPHRNQSRARLVLVHFRAAIKEFLQRPDEARLPSRAKRA